MRASSLLAFKCCFFAAICTMPSCALYDSYMMAKFDGHEYHMIAQIRTDSELAKLKCNSVEISRNNVVALNTKAKQLSNYSEFIPHNENTRQLSDNLYKLTDSTLTFYNNNANVSETFCKLKFDQITRAATTIQEVVGKRPR